MQSSPTDPVGLSWLVTVRWTMLLAGAGAVLAGRSALQVPVPVTAAVALLAVCGLSNVWLVWRIRAPHTAALPRIAGILVCADVLLLSWLLLKSGGVLNPASVFYLVEIVVVALVLGRNWTWIVTALAVAGYATLFLAPTDELRTALTMHPEIAGHVRGMWLAFALTALLIATLVTRLVIAVERRDHALEALRERTARATRAAGLGTLAAGAAHELSTPLSTIAVAARELQHIVAEKYSDPELQQDAQLIRAETERCRRILEEMAERSGEPTGESPRAASIDEVIAALRDRLGSVEWQRISVDVPSDLRVVWPVQVVARALGNLVQNALQASSDTEPVRVDVGTMADGTVRLAVVDRGAGMSAETLNRAAEPFFTTKPPGRGTGLGLFVTQSSVEQLGGRLLLSSTSGLGTTAAIVLPVNVVVPGSHDHV